VLGEVGFARVVGVGVGGERGESIGGVKLFVGIFSVVHVVEVGSEVK